MKCIANVISKTKKYKFNDFINITNTYDNIDKTVPTLIVGTELVKTIYGDKVNYINRKIDDNTFWTYSVIEKRSSNEEDIEKFKEFILKSLKKSIKYTFYNVLMENFVNFDNFIEFLMNREESYYLFTDKMLYISTINNVIGISLSACEYLGWKNEDIITEVISKTKNVTSIHNISEKIDKNFFKNDNILLSAMFCYLNR